MNRVTAAAGFATLGIIMYVLFAAGYRILDWIFQGSLLLWIALPLGWLAMFVFVIALDAATDGKVTGE